MTKVRKHPHAGLDAGPHRDFIKLVHDLAGPNRRHGRIFEDLVELAYCAMAQACASPARAAALEARYMAHVKAIGDDGYVRAMPELLGMVGNALVGDPDGAGDFLGRVAGELGVFSEGLGQFMTPWEIGKMLAALTLQHADRLVGECGFITLQEPACGTGGLVLAAAQALREAGHDPKETLFSTAIDVSPTMQRACFVQLALAGLPAHVCLGDSLSDAPFSEVAWTPAMVPFIARHGPRWQAWREQGRAPAPKPDDAPDPAPTPPAPTPAPRANLRVGQLDLFGEG